MSIRVAKAALSNTIYAGKVNKAGTTFLGEKTDVTSDVIKSIIEFIGDDNTHEVCVNGKIIYEISVKRIVGKKYIPTKNEENLRSMALRSALRDEDY